MNGFALRDGLHVGVKLVHERDAVGYAHFLNVKRAEVVDGLDDAAQAVAVGHNENVSAGAEVGKNLCLPEGCDAVNSILQGLRGGNQAGIQAGILALLLSEMVR